MLDSIVLIPILLLPLGAIVISLVASRIPEATRRWLPTALLTIELLAILLNAFPSSHRFELSRWDLASFSITFQLDGISFVLLLAIFIPLVALQLVAPRASLDAFALYVLSSSVLLVCAGNLITAFFAWAFLDFALYAWRQARSLPHDISIRALILGQLAGLALFTGAVLLDAKQNEIGAMLIALAFWARLGFFPFHWVSPIADTLTFELAAIRGATLVAGSSLWLRWSELKINVPTDMIAGLAALALFAELIWRAREGEALEKIAVNASVASLAVPLAIAFGGDPLAGSASAALVFAFWVTVSIAFALAMFEAGIAWPSDYQNRLPRLYFVAGILSLAGLPLTPAFLGRVGLYVTLAEKGQWVLLLVAPLVTTIALASLWRMGLALRGSEAREPTRREYAGLQLLGATFVVIGFAPMVVTQAMGQAASESLDQALNIVIRTNDFIGVSIGFFALIAPVVLSFLIARVNWGYHPQWNELAQLATRFIDLDWLARAIAAIARKLSAAAASLSALAEENPTVWILLVGLWIAIFILTSR